MFLTVSYRDLARHILSRPSSQRFRLIAIDGPGGAGKSTFAARLAQAFDAAPVVHTDDLARSDESDWWPMLEEGVLEPLFKGRPGRFRRYDWDSERLAEWVDVPCRDVVILEGVSSARRAIAERLAYSVWIDTPEDLRLERGIARDGEDMRTQWEVWMASEDKHFAEQNTRARVELIVDGSPSVPHDAATEFVVVGGPDAMSFGVHGVTAAPTTS